MSDDEDLFGDSSDGDDTAELIAATELKKKTSNAGKAKESSKATIPKKTPTGDNKRKTLSTGKRLQVKKSTTQNKKNKSKASSDDDEAAALFDSDSEEEDPTNGGKKSKSKTSTLSDKKSRMEALQAKRRENITSTTSKDGDGSKKRNREKGKTSKQGRDGGDKDEAGYDSGDSYDSGVFVRTKEDDDFIDAEGEDPDALRELYAEQHFDDEPPDDMDSEEGRKKKGDSKSNKKRGRVSGPDTVSDDELDDNGQPLNPIMAAVHRMKKKKKEVKKLDELEELAQAVLKRMTAAAEEDEKAIKDMRPATKKLVLLPEILNLLTKREMWRPLLESDLLSIARTWVQPLPNGSLGNVTIRQKLIESIGNMTGEQGVNKDDLKKSGFGKILMCLYMHKDETPEMKRQLKAIIDMWSRPIFQKSGNLRDLDVTLACRRGDAGIVGIAKAVASENDRSPSRASAPKGLKGDNDLSSILSKGVKLGRDLGNNRARIPFSKGFQYTVRPSNLTGDVTDKVTRAIAVKEERESLHKRMLQKVRPVSKNQRSAGISIEGRPTK